MLTFFLRNALDNQRFVINNSYNVPFYEVISVFDFFLFTTDQCHSYPVLHTRNTIIMAVNE